MGGDALVAGPVGLAATPGGDPDGPCTVAWLPPGETSGDPAGGDPPDGSLETVD